MLKTAYELGVKRAFDEMGLTPDQMSAAQQLGALGGGVVGAGLGGLGGNWLGGRAAEAFDLDDDTSRAVGSGLGALLGGGIGGYAGHQAPQLGKQAPANHGAESGIPAASDGDEGYGGEYAGGGLNLNDLYANYGNDGLGLDDLYMDPTYGY